VSDDLREAIAPLRGVSNAIEWDGTAELKFRAQGRSAQCAHFRALWVGTSGPVVVRLRSGSTITLRSVVAGVWHPIEFTALLPYTGQDIAQASGVVAGW
jgi:hypothetical protein